jgi:VWFA-related protein
MNLWRSVGLRFAAVVMAMFVSAFAYPQNTTSQEPQDRPPEFPAQSNLVLVPTLVTAKGGQVVFSLTSQDFTVLDNGITQKVTLDDDSSQRPLALVIVVQTGGVGTQQLPSLRHLETMIEAMVENTPHEVALVSFDSKPHLLQEFTPDLTQIGTRIQAVRSGDSGAGILDGLVFSLNLVQKQPPEFRRAVLLISEAIDHGSTTRLNEALRDVSETNTAVYSMTFSTSKAEIGAALANKDLPPETRSCLEAAARSKNGPSGAQQRCLSFTPLVVLGARLGIAGLSRNTPATIARLSGGEYMQFDNEKTLESGLSNIANQLPNRYILSFTPSSPTPGLHTIQVTVKNYPQLQVSARTSYWVAAKATHEPSSKHGEQENAKPQ